MVKLTTVFCAGCAPPLSLTLAAVTVSAQVSLANSAVLVEIVKLAPLVGWVSATAPDWLHCNANAPVASVTDSLKPTARSLAAGTPVAPSAGVVLVTTGRGLGVEKVWLRLQAPKVCVPDACQLKLA